MELAQAFVRLKIDRSQVAADTSAGIKEGAAAADVETAGAHTGARFGGALSKAARKAFQVGLVGAAGIGAASLVAATDFQTAMKRVQTQAGASASDVALLSKQVLALAPATQQGPIQLADALYHLKSVGLDNADAMNALAVSSKLAAVGGADLEQTTNAIAGAWRSGVKGAQNFGQAAATINAIIGAGNMQMSQFVAAMGSGVLAAASTFGISLKQVGGAMALLTDEGMPAELAATRLRMSIALLGAPSATAAKQLSTIGLSSTDLATAMRSPGGLVATIGLLKTHLDNSGLSAVQSAQLLSRAFGGGQSSSAILAMINQFDTLKQKQVQINDSVKKFGPDVAAQQKTAAAQFALLKSNLETLGIKIGDKLLGPVTGFVHYLTVDALPAVHHFGSMLMSYLPVRQLDQFWGVIKSIFGGPAKPKSANLPFSSLFTKPKTPDLSLGGLMGKQPVQDLPFSQLFTVKKSDTDQLGKSIGTLLASIDWKSVFSKMAAGAGDIGAAIATLFGKVNWTALGKTVAYDAVPFIIGLVNNLVSALISEAIHHPLDMALFLLSIFPIGKGLSWLGQVVEHLPFGGVLGGLLKGFGGVFEKAGKPIWKLLGKMLKLIFGDVPERALGFIGGVAKTLWTKGGDLIGGLVDGAESWWGKTAVPWLKGIGGKALRAVGSLAKILWNAGVSIITGLWDGMKSKFGGFISWVSSIGSAIARHKGPIEYDRVLLTPHGQAIMDGLHAGMLSRMPRLLGFLRGVTQTIDGASLTNGGLGGVGSDSGSSGPAPIVPGVPMLAGLPPEVAILLQILLELRKQPGRTAAGLSHALNGVGRSAVTGGRIG